MMSFSFLSAICPAVRNVLQTEKSFGIPCGHFFNFADVNALDLSEPGGYQRDVGAFIPFSNIIFSLMRIALKI